MLDCHCHLDRYEDPISVADEAQRKGVFTIAVTNLPSHFNAGLSHVRKYSKIRLALGMHPLSAECHIAERALFSESLHLTSFVGEVGLDFSRHGKDSRSEQEQTFRFVSSQIKKSGPKILSLHSRAAETAVLDVLTEFNLSPAIFHWYSGPLGVMDAALKAGHYFSVNPAMLESERGRRIIEQIPTHRLLSETDGPYAKLSGTPAKPWDVAAVESYVAKARGIDQAEVGLKIWENFRSMLCQLGLLDMPGPADNGI